MSFDINAKLRDCRSLRSRLTTPPELGRPGRVAHRCGSAIRHHVAAFSHRDPLRQARHRARLAIRAGQGSRLDRLLYEQVDLPGDGRELVDTGKVRNDGSFDLDVAPGPSQTLTSSTATTTRSSSANASTSTPWSAAVQGRRARQARERPKGPLPRANSRPQRLGPWDQPAGARREEVANLQAGEGRS